MGRFGYGKSAFRRAYNQFPGQEANIYGSQTAYHSHYAQKESEEYGADGAARNVIDDSAGAREDEAPEAEYQYYMPSKVQEGVAHPDPVVETASLASIQPPDISYQHSLGDVIAKQQLSSLQLESVIYASMKFDGPRLPNGTRAGFFLGDGAGVGKGRQIAALIKEQWSRGVRRVLWVSVSNDLKWDAERDLSDLDFEVPLYPKDNSLMPSDISLVGEGVLFVTYALLVAKGGKKRRLEQIIEYLRQAEDEAPLIVFDECHKAKNLLAHKGQKSAATALAVVELQDSLPHARILYCSATGASQAGNLAYMTRLGTWNFDDFGEFLTTMKSAGMGALEMFAMGLKATGFYLCRTLSYHGAEFELEYVKLTSEMIHQYNRAALFWQLLLKIHNEVGVKRATGLFWAFHMRFFRQMLIAAKVPALAAMSRKAVEDGMCVVIGLQSTGESNMKSKREEEDGEGADNFFSAPLMVIQGLLEHFPVKAKERDSEKLQRLEYKVQQSYADWAKAQAQRAMKPSNVDDDEIEVVKVMTPEEVEAAKLEQAKLSGVFFDLDEPPMEKVYEMDESRRQREEELVSQRRKEEQLESQRRREEELVRQRQREEEEQAEQKELARGAATGGTNVKFTGASPSEDHKRPAEEKLSGTAETVGTVRRSGRELQPSTRLRWGSSDVGETSLKRVKREPLHLTERDNVDGNAKDVKPAVGSFTSAAAEGSEEDWSPANKSDDPLKKKAKLSGKRKKPELCLELAVQQASAHDSGPSTPHSDPNVDEEFEEEVVDSNGLVPCPRLQRIKKVLLEMAEMLQLPPNPLDHLKDLCGGESVVAEMTGRIEQCVKGSNGTVTIRKRCEGVSAKKMNRMERQAFMDGKKLIAIISDAASCGISLHSDRRAQNQRRRLHVTLELPWSADKAIQQFGRSHRSNQATAPTYRLLVTDCNGEHRFASSAAKRLQSLGAISKGDRRALGAGKDLVKFDVDNKYGREALQRVYDDVTRNRQPMPGVPVPFVPGEKDFYNFALDRFQAVGLFGEDGRLQRYSGTYRSIRQRPLAVPQESKRVDRFLNRLMGLQVSEQKVLFEYFSNTLEAVIQLHKSKGKYDNGIIDLRAERITKMEGYPRCIHEDKSCHAQTFVTKLQVDRGLPWEKAVERLEEYKNQVWSADCSNYGFYISKEKARPHGRPQVILALETRRVREDQKFRLFRVLRPNNSCAPAMEYGVLCHTHELVEPAELAYAQELWQFNFDYFGTYCWHGKNCYYRTVLKKDCNNRSRLESHYVLSGAVLPIWKRLTESTLATVRVVRAQLESGEAVVGLHVGEKQLQNLETSLGTYTA